MMAANERNSVSLIEIIPWKQLARAGWYGCAAIALGIFVLSAATQINASGDAVHSILAAPEPSPWMYIVNIIGFVVRMAGTLISLILASVLFVKRPYEGMALFLSYFLLDYVVVFAGSLASLGPIWPDMGVFVYSVFEPVLFAPILVVFLSIFPNGRFVPSWTRWLVVASLFYAPLSPLLFNIEAFSGAKILYIIGALLWFAFVFAGLYAQAQRYRRVSSQIERRQMKWVLYGFALALLFVFLTTVSDFGLNRLGLEIPFSWWAQFDNLGSGLAIAAIPITLTFAVMRYRLYDIDIIINRTLVYGALTAIVVLIYVFIVGALGMFFQGQGNLLIALIATGLVAVLFQPLRERLQHGVNRLIYGERDDPIEALSHLGKSLEMALPSDQVLPALVETIAKTLKLSFVGIAIQGQPVVVFGQQSKNPAVIPLIFQGETAGELLAAPRDPDESFSPAEMRLLRNIARQAGPAVQAVQLTADLQRSRQNLVTAREEERLRLRRDLHDGLGPALASVIWQVDSARDIIPTDPSGAAQLLESSIAQAQAALADIRRLVYGLRPPALDELGLVGALEQSARQYQQISVTIESLVPLPSLPAAVEVAAYRIIQEALKNAIEHGKARNCVVCMSLDGGSAPGSLCLTIRDDGMGLPEAVKPGVGLVSMRERAEELGGTFKIHPWRVGGTEIEVCLPLL